MNIFKNLKIRTKLFLFGAVSIIAMFSTGAVSLLTLNTITSLSDETYNTVTLPTRHILNLASGFSEIKIAARDLALSQDAKAIEGYKNEIDASKEKVTKAISDYQEYLELYGAATEEELAYYNTISSSFPGFCIVLDRVVSAGVTGNNKVAVSLLQRELAAYSNLLTQSIDDLINENTKFASVANDYALDTQASSIRFIVIVIATAFLLLAAVAIIITLSISRPMAHMVEVAQNVSKGNLNVNIQSNSKDEMGILAGEFSTLVETLKTLVYDLEKLSEAHEKGDTGALIDVSKYTGSYMELADALNNMVTSYVDGTYEILDCLDGFGQGHFNSEIRVFPGDKSRINTTINALKMNLNGLSTDIQRLVKSAIKGRLSEQADSSRYKGDWSEIISALNTLMNSIAAPIEEASQVMKKMSMGDFSQQVTGDYKGDFSRIKISLNETGFHISSYIREISQILTAISNDNLDVKISREYLGEFSSIKNAVEKIINSLNKVISDMYISSEQVAMGARQISLSSMDLAQGASEQASNIEELYASIDLINNQTRHNAENAVKANELSGKSKEDAIMGNAEMQKMVQFMETIKESSDNISKIIRVIEEIAFQTNLLALNAAVEAASAGVHGKGFAVVAEEVSSLAGRSQKAAQETAMLIKDSIEKVTFGTTLATQTSEMLSGIVENVNEVSTIVEKITIASQEQNNSIQQVSTGISQISEVVKRNSTTSEEVASAAQEMTSQSEMLESMVSVFKLAGK